MEEILASIRRIIEDSDVARQSVTPAETPVLPRGEVAPFRRPAAEVTPDTLLRQPTVAAPAAPIQETAKPFVPVQPLADILGSGLRGLIHDTPQSQSQSQPHAQPAPEQIARVEPVLAPQFNEQDETDEDEDEIVLDAHNDDRLEARRIAEPEHVAEQFDDSAEQSIEDDITQAIADMMADDEELVVPLATTAADAVPSEDHRGHSIISENTGRQVAAAFGDLSEVLKAEQRRSFDEMAEQLMRPMLQDWLDNNLPTLVEKLVREEIERVVRGDRT